ncbi:hypothetical protein [Cupriavidus sp. D39]|uniref:hypothetical protein n=1 Tax=Cupriavidus sp. D39 TaxID=2997877 RepID=UPI00226F2DA0|nr:hypothetical protein [Cupriavidus sp. D39]MCY0853840.1 hypothetical protein [Cupriavidus sp. D39]
MAIDERRSRCLAELADVLVSVFPDGAVWTRIAESSRNFFFGWPLKNQPANLAQYSRSVSIYFSDEALNAYWKLATPEREAARRALRRVILQGMVGYDEGRAFKRYAVKEAWRIDTWPMWDEAIGA